MRRVSVIKEDQGMNFGLGAILLIVAIALFVLGALSDTNWPEFTGLGLAAFAGSFLASALGWGDRTFGTSGGSSSTTDGP
jgi:hypothetical protein